jgi:hypothetical protein
MSFYISRNNIVKMVKYPAPKPIKTHFSPVSLHLHKNVTDIYNFSFYGIFNNYPPECKKCCYFINLHENTNIPKHYCKLHKVSTLESRLDGNKCGIFGFNYKPVHR